MSEGAVSQTVTLRRWADGDLPLLTALLGDPAMMEHLGGPESAEQLAKRQQRYLALTDPTKAQMFVVLLGAEAAGSVGYWEHDWRGRTAYEMGWSVLPAFQGRGIAVQGTLAAIAILRPLALHRYIHAFPSVENAASNAVCRKSGFTLIEAVDSEYPKGHPMRVNDWQLDLQNNQ
ncbi:MAG TPA: GNAT family N-acetyltransferase [Phototrophicaceae bacterium]|nr:GNAT family N-acetyltransferase [Phototrophicaceae bacterium]